MPEIINTNREVANRMLEVLPGIGEKLLHRRGIRERDGKWAVEVRPPGFQRKLWLGTFNEEWAAQIAFYDYIAHCEVNQTDEDKSIVCSPDWPTDETLIEEFQSLDPMCGTGKEQGKAHCRFAKKMRERISRIIEREKAGLVINPATGEVIFSYGEVFSVLSEDIREQSCVKFGLIGVDVDDCNSEKHWLVIAEDIVVEMIQGTAVETDGELLGSNVMYPTVHSADLAPTTTTANASIANPASLAPMMTTADKVLAEGGVVLGFGLYFDDMCHGGAQNVHIGCTQDALLDSGNEGK